MITLLARNKLRLVWWLLLGLCLGAGMAQAADDVGLADAKLAQSVCAHMQHLAGDALEGRGSGSIHERAAAVYIASQLKSYGIEPAASDGGYVEPIEVESRTATAPPALSFRRGREEVRWKHGRQFVAHRLAEGHISGSLVKIAAGEVPAQVARGSVVYLEGDGGNNPWAEANNLVEAGAAAVLLPRSAVDDAQWARFSSRLPRISSRVAQTVGDLGGEFSEVVLGDEASRAFSALPAGTRITLDAPLKSRPAHTWNAVGKITGSDPKLREQAILLSSHLDHLGTASGPHGKIIYYGADDDASGVSAVLELARALAAGPRPKRTVIFAFFGSEESEGLGSTWFRQHPPVPLDRILADLEFEMLGRPDPAISRGSLWLTGYERTDLGPTLDAHGARLVADPHPEQQFFERSDNYVFAKKGVIAQTVSSYGLHADYHRPTDDLAHIDFLHLDAAIQSMIEPVTWLANSDFLPRWKPGGRP